MGTKQHKVQCEHFDDCLAELMNSSQKSNNHLSNLLARFTGNIKFEKQVKINFQGKQIWITESIVRLYTHPSFIERTVQYYHILRKYLQKLLQNKAMIFITHEQWKLCYGLSQFIMLCCDQQILKFMSQPDRITYTEADELYGQMQQLLQNKFQPMSHIEDLLTAVQKSLVIKTFKNFMYFSVCMKNKLISDFSSIFTMVYASVESLLCLYAKIQKDYTSRESFKRNIYTAAYAVGLGVQYDHPATINLAVKILTKIVKGQQKTVQQVIKINSIPSHNFQQIPLLTCTNIYETITTYLLYILCLKISQVHVQPIIRLVGKMITVFQPKNKQIPYYLQKLCQDNRGMTDKTKIMKILKSYQQANLKKTEIIQKFININEPINQSQIKTDGYLQITQNNLRLAQVDSTESKKCDSERQQTLQTYQKQIIHIYHKITIKKFMPQIKIQNISSNFPISSKLKTQPIVPSIMKEVEQVASEKHMIKSRELAIQEYTQDG